MLFTNLIIALALIGVTGNCWKLQMGYKRIWLRPKGYKGFVQRITTNENALFNDGLNTFYLRLYGVGHMVKDHSDSERGNPMQPHRLLFSISSKGSFICIIPQTG